MSKEYFEIEVKNDSGKLVKTYKIKRVKRSKLNDLIELQRELLYSFIKNNASTGASITDDAVWHNMELIAAMLPVVGEEKLGFPLSEIEDDYTQLRDIFFCGCEIVNGVINTDNGFIPSKIAELHQLDYQGDWGKGAEKVVEDMREAKTAMEQIAATPESPTEITESVS